MISTFFDSSEGAVGRRGHTIHGISPAFDRLVGPPPAGVSPPRTDREESARWRMSPWKWYAVGTRRGPPAGDRSVGATPTDVDGPHAHLFERTRRRIELIFSVRPPACDLSRGAHAATVSVPDVEIREGSGRGRGLVVIGFPLVAVRVGAKSPARDRSIGPQATRKVPVSYPNMLECSGWRCRFTMTVVSPAHDRVVGAKRTGMLRAQRYSLERSGRSRQNSFGPSPPATEAAIPPDDARIANCCSE
jgi:hypothetical protein